MAVAFDPSAGPDVAVLVVNWNTRDLLAACLHSIGPAAGSLHPQVIVLDNASGDGSADMVRACFPLVLLLPQQENLGFVEGSNRAAAMADPRARFLLLLNPDAALRPQALETLVLWMDAHPEAGACGPRLLNPDGTPQPSWSRFPTLLTELWGVQDRRFRPAGRVTDAQATDWLGGACLLIRRNALDGSLGGCLLDPAFGMYSEETDLCFRLKQAGWPVFLVPQAGAVHYGGQSSRQAPLRTTQALYRSKILFFRKHYGPGAARRLRFGLRAAAWLKEMACGLLGRNEERDRHRAVRLFLGSADEDRD